MFLTVVFKLSGYSVGTTLFFKAKALRILLSFFLLISLVACNSNIDVSVEGKPAHHTVDGFKNVYVKDPNKNLFDFLKMKFFGGFEWADHESLATTVPTKMVDVEKLHNPPAGLQITWLGHSTFLIQKDGVNVLSDPIFGDRSFGVTFMGPKRYAPHVIDYKQLPKIDYVIISHSHYDHLDSIAVSELGNEPKYLVPLKLKSWFLDRGISKENVMEFDWGDKVRFNNLDVTALPSQHWSARGLFDRRETLWASWALNLGGEKIWFAGDTGYNPVQFKEIGERSGPFDVALIPIGAYEPRGFMKTYHVNPEEAVKIHQDVKATQSIGMHWGTFPLTAEAPMAPVEELAKQKQNYKLGENEFIAMTMGETQLIP